MFKKILIANRGEIAVRIVRACRELGIPSVVVYSTADKDSLAVKIADESVCIGAPPSEESYLNIPAIISAAEISGADAIHPGYGFLAESSYFCDICETCKITFIGSSKESIQKMGDKIEAKKIASKLGIPLIKGSGIITDPDKAIQIAQKIGFPLIVKAAGGGGGKGMRIAKDKDSLQNAILVAQSEAQAAFGRNEVYLEKYIAQPRHIEFQIIADKYNKVVYLPERDCSIQRRHQKLIEESPSPIINNKLRKEMGEMAIKIVKEIHYFTVGTVEFLIDKNNAFYFMEMNTRIQVEHPVSEMVTDLDLLKYQILTAAGEKLDLSQKDISLRGHAIECRINAEDPEKDFIPSPGNVPLFIPPGGPGVRVDTDVYSGYNISPYYDSMIAKIITLGKNRNEAILRMQRALKECVIENVKNTIPFHQKVLSNLHFIKGDYSTNFITEQLNTSK